MRGRENDIWENPKVGELVIPPFPVQVPLGSFADDEDGVSRSFYSLATGNRTSVALVRDIPVSVDSLRAQARDFLLGFVFKNQLLDESYKVDKVVGTHVDRMLVLVHTFRFNDLVEIRDGRIAIRTLTLKPHESGRKGA